MNAERGRFMFLPDEIYIDDYLDYSWVFINFKDYYGPERYLQDAIDDLASGNDRRHYNNAVRNAKSALHMRVDIIYHCFCGTKTPRKIKSFPHKMDYLESIGIVRPRIIDKINKIRNEIEHEYRDATREEAEDFVDIVLLFIEATKHLNSRFPSEINFYGICKKNNMKYLIKILCDFECGKLNFIFEEQNDLTSNKVHKEFIYAGTEAYIKWLNFINVNND